MSSKRRYLFRPLFLFTKVSRHVSPACQTRGPFRPSSLPSDTTYPCALLYPRTYFLHSCNKPYTHVNHMTLQYLLSYVSHLWFHSSSGGRNLWASRSQSVPMSSALTIEITPARKVSLSFQTYRMTANFFVGLRLSTSATTSLLCFRIRVYA
jgi:hypothetical protein